MKNHIVLRSWLILSICIAAIYFVDARADSLHTSGGNFISVQAAEFDQSKNSLSMLIAIGPKAGPGKENALSIVSLGKLDKRINRNFELDHSFDIFPPLSFYSDVEEGVYLIAHNSRSGTTLRWFDASGRLQKEQLAPFAGDGVFGIARLEENLHFVTNTGISVLKEDGSSTQIFAVEGNTFIASYSMINEDECDFAVIVVDADHTYWELQILCSSRGKMVVRHKVPGSTIILPGVLTKILRVSMKTGTAWVAGPSEESKVAISKCDFAPKPKCEAVPLNITLSGYPLIATHVPVAMISDNTVVTGYGENGIVTLVLYKLDGRKVYEQELNLSRTMGSDEYITKVSGLDVLVSNNLIWVLAQTVALNASNAEAFIKEGYLFEIGFNTFHFDEESQILEPLRGDQ